MLRKGPQLALLGGEPIFDRPRHVAQLNMPAAGDFVAAFHEIFERRHYANHGPLVNRLDEVIAELCQVRHAICVVNATTGLMLLARGLNVVGDVLLPSFTFPATVQAMTWAGLNPIFCDVDPQQHTITPATVSRRLSAKSSAILGVHLWGRAADVDGLCSIAKSYSLKLIFDAAHALGCSYKGRPIGSFGEGEVFSFHATKVLNGAEGGCITTNDNALANRLRIMRSFHDDDTSVPPLLRMNAKMSEAQAAMALLSIEQLPANIEHNRRQYYLYRDELQGVCGFDFVDHAGNETSNYQYVVLSVNEASARLSRDEVARALWAENILASRWFTPGVHLSAPFVEKPTPVLPATERLSESLLQLPIGQSISDEDVRLICRALRSIKLAAADIHAKLSLS